MSITTVTHSGITTELVPPRPPSPAFGSPLRKEAALAEEEEAVEVVAEDEEEVEAILQSVARRERKEKKKEREKGKDPSVIADRPRERERKRLRDSEEPAFFVEGSKSKLKDVTNSQATFPTLSNIDAGSDRERQHTPEDDIPIASGSGRASSSSTFTRNFLSTPAPKSSSSSQPLSLPTPRSSSPVPSVPTVEAEPTGGRERRTRKSVNYAEPKLNTKMRKPDPPPSSMTKRASMDSGGSRESPEATDTAQALLTANADGTAPTATIKRKKSRAYVVPEDGEESEGTQADAEYGGSIKNGSGWVNLEGRRRSVISSSSIRRIEGDDARRHSMAV